ncbi:PREDICTED: uncharacterized protein B0303.7 [Ceratosolen solmsi marchali]|uniref:Uncharacterized protein B0303.7 n=1 Tax=Ceratosolen solmsi marchali TaxID=326594 RepID=A0AAJ6VJZ5_9HYME|nr:PREDICTED: uncharacterized protein B0303.7 [Ceratosolen solmsi marchali]
MDLLTEMRVPTRSAPRPPAENLPSQRNSGLWSSSNEFFGSALQAPQKKKPPPRPPPPKFQTKHVNMEEKPKKAVRPTELLTNLFGRRVSKHQHQQQHHHLQHHHSSSITASTSTSNNNNNSNGNTNISNEQQQQQHQRLVTPNGVATTFQLSAPKLDSNSSVCLIDLSPPGSPTFTTRSSSDGVSVDSFGSDGNSNPSLFVSSGSASQTESAFEDDFDFFGSLSSRKQQQQQQQQQQHQQQHSGDPWRISCSQDPFGSLESSATSSKTTANTTSSQPWPVTTSQRVKEVGDSSFFAFNDGGLFEQAQVPRKPFVMPTIIRGKPCKSSAPKPAPSRIIPRSTNYSNAPRFHPSQEASFAKDFWDEEASSLPMPSQPPPPPPPECIAELEDGLPENTERPYGVALYDFEASQAGDLDLKEGDVVYLTNLINDNWMEGRVGDREGIFPVNFLDVKIPLPGQNANVVNALYTFKAEITEDLSFEEGARIKVLSRISDDWLYGEYNGKKGQFPANFVDKVPSDLPKHL